MRFCRYCGASIKDDDELCYSCGACVCPRAKYEEEKENENKYVKPRSIGSAILLSIITLGIYYIFWFIKVNDEMLELRRKKGLPGLIVFVLDVVTLGIYSKFWSYRMGTYAGETTNDSKTGMGIIFLILSFCNLTFANVIILQSVINSSSYNCE